MRRCLLPLVALCLAFSSHAQEQPAAAQRSPEALKVLEQADAAIKAVHAVRLTAKLVPSGIAVNFVRPAEATTTMVGWNGSMPQKFLADVQMPGPTGKGVVSVTGGGDGDTFFVVDHATKKGYEDMDPAVIGSHGQTLRSATMLEFVHDHPFDDELGAEVVELLGTETVAGQECDKVRVVYGGGQGESLWFFSKKDHLPRRRVRIFSTPNGDGAVDLTIAKLEIDPPADASSFKMKLPEGYEQIDDFAP